MRQTLMCVLFVLGCGGESGESKAAKACESATGTTKLLRCHELATGSWYANDRKDQKGLAEGQAATWERSLSDAIAEVCTRIQGEPPPDCKVICGKILANPEFKGRASADACDKFAE